MNARQEAMALIAAYYAAFNAGDRRAMLGLVTDDIEHHVNEGVVRRGRDLFEQFNAHMAETYREHLTDMVIMAAEAGDRGGAEFTVNGTYLKTEPGLPEARGQSYKLAAGAFMTLRRGRISRITTYYNLSDWMTQVS